MDRTWPVDWKINNMKNNNSQQPQQKSVVQPSNNLNLLAPNDAQVQQAQPQQVPQAEVPQNAQINLGLLAPNPQQQ